jgi:single-strand DNA-binding protein
MADNTVTLVGNVTDDPELRFTPTGRPVANFTVAVNKRFKDNDGQWQDRLDGFFRCNCWADMAENVAESLTKGTRIVVTGRLQQRQWEDNDGNKRSAFEIQVDEVGPSLRWATATVQKSQRSGGQSSGGGGQQSGGGQSSGGSDWSAPAPVGGPDEGGF